MRSPPGGGAWANAEAHSDRGGFPGGGGGEGARLLRLTGAAAGVGARPRGAASGDSDRCALADRRGLADRRVFPAAGRRGAGAAVPRPRGGARRGDSEVRGDADGRRGGVAAAGGRRADGEATPRGDVGASASKSAGGGGDRGGDA